MKDSLKKPPAIKQKSKVPVTGNSADKLSLESLQRVHRRTDRQRVVFFTLQKNAWGRSVKSVTADPRMPKLY